MNLLNKRNKIFYWFCIIAVVIIILIAFSVLRQRAQDGEVVKTALSPDANYALTTDAKNYAIIWNLIKHTKKIISRDANMYSAYWINNTTDYVWQSLSDKVVHVVDNTTGKEIKTFHPNRLAYGQAISTNLQNYVMSDWNWDIYLYQNKQRYQLAKMFTSGTFEGANKIINFTFLGNDKILASGMAYPTGNLRWGPSLFDLNTKKMIHKYLGNMVQTFATISPDGKYIVAGDNNFRQFVWSLKNGKNVVRIFGGQPWTGISKSGSFITDKNVLPLPNDFDDRYAVIGIKYIDDTHYLVFTQDAHHAILYQTLNPKPLKYLDLGDNPVPATYDLERDQSMDTSPSAHILVMAKNEQPGIMVYHYNPKTQTLTKIWDA